MERLGKVMVVHPAKKILSVFTREFAMAGLEDGEADDTSQQELLDFVHNVIERFELCALRRRSSGASSAE
jgi:hypothetical protein